MKFNRLILSRLTANSSPILAFAFSIVSLWAAKDNQILELAKSIAYAQLFGALPGIALGLIQSAEPHPPNRKRIAREFAGSITLILISLTLISQTTAIQLFLTASAFTATYIDTLIKRFNPKKLPTLRIIQSTIWLTMIIGAIILGPKIDSSILLFGRILGYCALAIGFAYIPYTHHRNNGGYSQQSIKNGLQNLIWMTGSNSIFLIPVILFQSNSTQTSNEGLVAYTAQIALQISGRLSDYFTTSQRLGAQAGTKETILIATATSILFTSLIYLKNNESHQITTSTAIAIGLLITSTIIWAITDSKLTTAILESPDNSKTASYSGTLALTASTISSLIVWEYIENSPGLAQSIPIMIGASIYMLITKRFSK